MKRRCYNSKHQDFKYYYNVKVCDEWRNNFQKFYEWSKGKYIKGLVLDRINNKGNYEPSNCRFVTIKINNRNKSNTKLNNDKVRKIRALCKEKKMCQCKIAKMFGVSEETISAVKLRKKWSDVN